MRPKTAFGIGAALLSILAIGGFTYARRTASSRRAARAAASLAAAVAEGALVLHVPHASGVTLDGDTDDPAWTRPPGPAKTNGFLGEDGTPARPYSQARLVWGDDYLYMALYASDEDIESRVDRNDAPVGPDDDAFHVVFSRGETEYGFDVSPNGLITDAIRHGTGAWDSSWSAGVHASREMDGTLNDPKNFDEEWEIELAIPLASLDLRGERGENLGLSIHRCDTPKRRRRVCSGWGDGEDGRQRGWIVLD